MNHRTLAAVSLGLLLVSVAARSQTPAPAQSPNMDWVLFERIASVLQHPRCMNCHTVTQFPRQTDTQVRHVQLVVRGKEGKGAETLQCAACHQEHNSDDGKVPGAHGWHLAPLSMGWEGLTKAQICASIKDPSRNRGRDTLEKVIEHMKVDPLVKWAWAPGAGRATPPVPSHESFVKDLEAWVAAGAPCPGDGESTAKGMGTP